MKQINKLLIVYYTNIKIAVNMTVEQILKTIGSEMYPKIHGNRYADHILDYKNLAIYLQ